MSNDLGAIAALCFDVGKGRYPAPPAAADAGAHDAWERDLAAVREEAASNAKEIARQRAGDLTHTQVQGWLRDVGIALGFQVWIAINDGGRPYEGGTLADRCLEKLPAWLADHPGADAVRLIDVLWIDPANEDVAAAFEVEHTTSIYSGIVRLLSGIVRLLDLALGAPERAIKGLFLVAPDAREADVRDQLRRPAFRRVLDLDMRFLPYGELERNREAMARFGRGLHPVDAVSRRLR